jgi:glycosyltransferase involved in cell wall biosynthesis
MSRNALMVAFHFPPFAQSTGSIRTLSFVRRLLEYDWQPVVLTARPNAYPEVDDRSLAMIPPSVRVVRAAGLDVARHLAIAGRYPTWLATPDRWNTWAAAAFVAGLACIRRDRPFLIWATFPIASALLVAMALHEVTKIPLVVDLRDPMIYEGWPENRWIRATYTRIERRATALASAVIVTTPSARRLYVERYSHLPASRFRMIANGVDDTMDVAVPRSRATWSEPIVLVHSGLMEIPDRDPTAFFQAIAQMRQQGDIDNNVLHVTLRATGRDDDYRRQIAELGIDDIATIEGRISHAEALEEMRRADGLILFQGAQCNRQIPAKAYEYLACRRPIIGLVDSLGDTHELIADQWQVPYIADMSSTRDIAEVLRKFVIDFRRHDVFVPDESWVEKNSRAQGARQLAEVFDHVSGEAVRA